MKRRRWVIFLARHDFRQDFDVILGLLVVDFGRLLPDSDSDTIVGEASSAESAGVLGNAVDLSSGE